MRAQPSDFRSMMWVVTHRADKRGVFRMKLRLLIAGFCVLGLAVSSAVAAPPPGKGKPETAGKPVSTGTHCKPKVTVVLKGKLTSAAAGSLAMDVSQANRWGRAWATLGTATVVVDDTTKVRRRQETAERARRRRSDARPGTRVQGRPHGRDRARSDRRACRRTPCQGLRPSISPITTPGDALRVVHRRS